MKGTLAPSLRVLMAALGVLALGMAVFVLAYPAPFSSAKTSKTTTTDSGAKGESAKIVLSSSHESPSDGLVGGIAAVGAVLLLASAFFARISSVKALGVEIGLTEEEKKTVAKEGEGKVKEALGELGVSTQEADALAANLILFALDAGEHARSQKIVALTSPGDDALAPPTAVFSPEATILSQREAADAIDAAARKRLGLGS
jgi:hypothetical protein